MRHGTARARGPATRRECSPERARRSTTADGHPRHRYRWRLLGAAPPCHHRSVRARPGLGDYPPAPVGTSVPAPTTHGPGATASGSIFRRIVGPDRMAVPDTYPGRAAGGPDGSRGGARRAPRHRPRDRRSPGRLARPARAAADDRGRHETGAPGGCHDDPDRPRRPARDDRLGRHPRRRGRPAAGLSARRSLGRGGPADRSGAGPAGRPRGRRLRRSSATRASRWPAT